MVRGLAFGCAACAFGHEVGSVSVELCVAVGQLRTCARSSCFGLASAISKRRACPQLDAAGRAAMPPDFGPRDGKERMLSSVWVICLALTAWDVGISGQCESTFVVVAVRVM